MDLSNTGETKPLANRRVTIFGAGFTFQVVAMIAVIFRLYVRLRMMKNSWWDDLLLVFALISVTIGTTFVCICTYWGLGGHFYDIPPTQLPQYLRFFYIANGSYHISTALIKLSLLFQYLRVFETGLMRKTTITLIIIIAAWGVVYSFMAWFPCFPVRAYWDWTLTEAKCYAYGTKERQPFVTAYVSHSAFNMVFDVCVLVTPVSMVWARQRARRELVAIGALSAVGVLIIVISSWRLATIVHHQAGWEPVMDFTWYTPISIILACLEVDIAILAASMPVFWPVILRVFEPIFVTREITITRDPLPEGYKASRKRRKSLTRPEECHVRKSSSQMFSPESSHFDFADVERESVHSEAGLSRNMSLGKGERGYTVEEIPLEEMPSRSGQEGRDQAKWKGVLGW